MSAAVSSADLQRALKDLRENWEATRQHWNDKVSEEFAEDFLAPLDEHAQRAIGAINRLAQIMIQARGHCE